MIITILGITIIFLLYLLYSEFYIVRRLKIKKPKKGLFTKGRKKIFVYIELLLFLFMALYVFILEDYSFDSSNILPFVLPIFTALLFFLRGIEEWITNREAKIYYHEWSSSIAFLIMTLFFFLSRKIGW